MFTGFHVKYPLSLSDFNQTNLLTNFQKNSQISEFVKICPIGAACQILIKLKFINKFSKNSQISEFVKIRPVGAQLFHDRQMVGHMDRWDKANSSFHSFVNMPIMFPCHFFSSSPTV